MATGRLTNCDVSCSYDTDLLGRRTGFHFLHKVALSRRLLNFNPRFPCLGNIKDVVLTNWQAAVKPKPPNSGIAEQTTIRSETNVYKQPNLNVNRLTNIQLVLVKLLLIIMTLSLTINFRQKCIVELSIITPIHRCKQFTRHWSHNECRCCAHDVTLEKKEPGNVFQKTITGISCALRHMTYVYILEIGDLWFNDNKEHRIQYDFF